ncbi:MAG: C4-type zinc ribbon domain-containing protein [Deltaproteobacteria bacterium]|nr:C4-type zinc ribbon domain-containing protein [Deltaproteobacteria bacterium]
MQETILKLINLQNLDNKIRLWHQTSVEGPGKIDSARKKLTALENQLQELEAKLAENSDAQKELKEVIAQWAQRKDTNQSRQLKARNTEEYRAVVKESEAIVQTQTAKDDELLILMAEAEKLESNLPGLRSDIAEETKSFLEKEAEILAIIADGQKNESGALREREELVPRIPAQILAQYSMIAKSREGQGIAPVVQGMCRCCRLSIPPQLYNELQRSDKIISCPNCSRILYWMHHPAFQEYCTEPLVAAPEKPEKPAKAETAKKRKNSKSKEDLSADAESKKNDLLSELESPEGGNEVASL